MAYHQRGRYWSNSKFADWIRTTFASKKKLKCGTAEEWHAWHKDMANNHPIVDYISDDLLDNLQNFVNWPSDQINDIRIYCRNRFITQTHYARTGLKPGQWHETDTRILHANFGMLVDFIEVEKAHMMLWSHPELDRPWWRKFKLTNWGEFRSRELGMKHLDWEMSLVYDEHMGIYSGDELYKLPTGQAEAAYEQYLLYTWWKDVRPSRPDPYDESGYSTYFEHMRKKAEAAGEDEFHSLFGGEKTEEEVLMQKLASASCELLEKHYEEEDTAMLIRLIKLRHQLWT
jgi:hypothetical protein